MKQRIYKMFKKTLAALAISAVAVSGVANAAAGIVSANVNVALEGNLAASKGAATLAAADLSGVVLTTGTAYIINDLVTFTVSGAVFDKTVTPPTLAPGNVGSTFTFVDFSGDNTARFRVTTQDEVAGEALTFAAFALKTTGAVDKGEIKITSTAISVNPLIGAYDAQKATTAQATFAAQLVNTITKLDGEVSTGNGRAQFGTSGSGINLDELTIATVNNSGYHDALDVQKAVHTLTGNFSWLMDYDADKDGVLEPTEVATAVTFTAGTNDTVVYAINTALTEITATQSVVGGANALDGNVKFGFNNKGNAAGGSVILAPQSFTYSTVLTDATPTGITLAGSAGAFTLDGSSTDIAFLPYGTDYAQSITVTNTGSVEGAITVTITNNGTKYVKVLTAVSTAKSVTNISAEVAAFAATSGVVGEAAINVTTNAPGVVVKGLYYHKPTQDRVLTQ